MTEKDAIKAILAHPHLAAKMALTKIEYEILISADVVTISDLKLKYGLSNSSRFMRKLIEKGYFKRISYGTFKRVY